MHPIRRLTRGLERSWPTIWPETQAGRVGDQLGSILKMVVLLLSHLAAFISALMTGFGASLAMLRLVFRAFITTSLTNLRTECAEFFCIFRAARHELNRQAADIGAVPVKLNAPSHHFNVLFLQTR